MGFLFWAAIPILEGMNLYTFFFEFEGGTYVSQVRGEAPRLAMRVWAENLETSQIKGLGPRVKEEILQAIEAEEPVLLGGLESVWCFTLNPLGRFCIVNFVATNQSVESNANSGRRGR